MKREPVEKKPVKKVISYHMLPYGQRYKVFITYIIYTGHAIDDIKKKYEEDFVCNAERVAILREKYDNSMAFVEKRLKVEFRQIGANEFVTKTEIAKLWQR
ncbi:MAG: hypothetical protein J6W40_04735 [Alphaproteobacteria bacterium]|nr:hypothetical protein [Alphaproteobacteria bacterium]